MKRLIFALALALLAVPAFGQQSAADAVDARNPAYLRANDKESNAKFLQCLTLAIPGSGYLSKSDGENGYTWPNGVRTSHDVIAFSDGSRVDVISGSDQPGTPASPSWGVIPKHEWRASNVYIPANAVPRIANCDGGTVDPPDPVKPPVPQPQPVNLQPILDKLASLEQAVMALKAAVDGYSGSVVTAANAAWQAADSARSAARDTLAIVDNMEERVELANTNIDRALQQLGKPLRCSGRIRVTGTSDFTCQQ